MIDSAAYILIGAAGTLFVITIAALFLWIYVEGRFRKSQEALYEDLDRQDRQFGERRAAFLRDLENLERDRDEGCSTDEENV